MKYQQLINIRIQSDFFNQIFLENSQLDTRIIINTESNSRVVFVRVIRDPKNRFYRWVSSYQTLQFHRMPLIIGCFDCSPCGKYIIVGQESNLVIYDPIQKTQFGVDLVSHQDLIILVFYSPDGNSIASMERNKSVKIWDTQTQQLRHTILGFRVQYTWLQYSPNSKQLMIFDPRRIKIYDGQSGVQLYAVSIYSATNVRYSNNEQLLFSKAQNIKLWNIRQQKTILQYTGYSEITAMAESSNGLIFAGSIELTLTIWVKKNGMKLRVLRGHTGFIDHIVLSADKRRMISQTEEETYIWDLHSAKYRRLPHIFSMDHRDEIKFSVNGKYMISKNGNFSLCIMKRCYILFSRLNGKNK